MTLQEVAAILGVIALAGLPVWGALLMVAVDK